MVGKGFRGEADLTLSLSLKWQVGFRMEIHSGSGESHGQKKWRVPHFQGVCRRVLQQEQKAIICEVAIVGLNH